MVEENGAISDKDSDNLTETLKLQSSFYEDWYNEDVLLKNNYILIQTFHNSEKSSFTLRARAFREEGDYDYHYHINGPWQTLKDQVKEEGLEISEKIIESPCKVLLRSLAVMIKARIKLSFHSSFFIIPRVFNEITSSTPVIKILKDANLRGLFIIFGSINHITHRFNFIKQHQIPDIEPPSDYKELEIEIIDNGDDKIFFNVSNLGKVQSTKFFSISCFGFMPILTETHTYFAGCGDSILVKSISMQYRERINHSPKPKRAPECVCELM